MCKLKIYGKPRCLRCQNEARTAERRAYEAVDSANSAGQKMRAAAQAIRTAVIEKLIPTVKQYLPEVGWDLTVAAESAGQLPGAYATRDQMATEHTSARIEAVDEWADKQDGGFDPADEAALRKLAIENTKLHRKREMLRIAKRRAKLKHRLRKATPAHRRVKMLEFEAKVIEERRDWDDGADFDKETAENAEKLTRARFQRRLGNRNLSPAEREHLLAKYDLKQVKRKEKVHAQLINEYHAERARAQRARVAEALSTPATRGFVDDPGMPETEVPEPVNTLGMFGDDGEPGLHDLQLYGAQRAAVGYGRTKLNLVAEAYADVSPHTLSLDTARAHMISAELEHGFHELEEALNPQDADRAAAIQQAIQEAEAEMRQAQDETHSRRGLMDEYQNLVQQAQKATVESAILAHHTKVAQDRLQAREAQLRASGKTFKDDPIWATLNSSHGVLKARRDDKSSDRAYLQAGTGHYGTQLEATRAGYAAAKKAESEARARLNAALNLGAPQPEAADAA